MAEPIPTRVPVTPRALLQRINRKLAHDGQALRASRGRERDTLGDFYLLDTHQNTVIDHHVRPELLGRELGVLDAWERLTAKE